MDAKPAWKTPRGKGTDKMRVATNPWNVAMEGPATTVPETKKKGDKGGTGKLSVEPNAWGTWQRMEGWRWPHSGSCLCEVSVRRGRVGGSGDSSKFRCAFPVGVL